MNALINFLMQEDVKQFIKDNLYSDTSKLLLNPPKDLKSGINNIVDQIISRQKAKGKLEDWRNNFDLIMPPPLSIEQASSNTTCKYKSKLISGHHFIDLTGGMGIDFLALSDSFERATYVETQKNLCEVFQHNLRELNKDAEVINSDAIDFLSNLNSESGNRIIYLDPARRDDNKSRVFAIEDCTPNLIELLPELRKKASRALVKFSPMLDIQSILDSVSNVKEVHVVSVKNECKELLLLIDFEFNGSPEIICANLDTNQPVYSFKVEEEREITATNSSELEYLLEPNSSIMKAGAFNKLSVDMGAQKISANTHLYTSNDPIENFPGRTFKILGEVDKKSIARFASDKKINVITRNHPLSANELKKKWKLKDGGDYFLIAFRNQANTPMIVVADRLD